MNIENALQISGFSTESDPRGMVTDEHTQRALVSLLGTLGLSYDSLVSDLRIIGESFPMIQDGKPLSKSTVRQQIEQGLDKSIDCKLHTSLASIYLVDRQIPHYVVLQRGKSHPNIVVVINGTTYWLNYTYHGLTTEECRYRLEETPSQLNGDILRTGLDCPIDLDLHYLRAKTVKPD